MTDLWNETRKQYVFDKNKDLYEQIYNIVEEKLIWYSRYLPRHKAYKKENWSKLSLDERYVLITSLNMPYIHIEQSIKEAKTIEEKKTLFNKIVWHIPQYIVTKILKSNRPKKPNTYYKPIIKYNDCVVKKEINNNWTSEDIFNISGRLKNPKNISFNINNKKINPNLKYKNFDYTTNNKPVSLKNFVNDDNLLTVKVSCTKDVIENCDNLFYGCINMINCDLSNINLNYCDSFKNMFYGCSNLKVIDFSNLDLDINDPDTTNMFAGCYLLKTVICKNCSDSTIWQLKCILSQNGLNVTIIK